MLEYNRAIIILLAVLCLAATPHETVQCARVVDGDTIELSTGERVRYIGVNTAEKKCRLGRIITEYNRLMVEGKNLKLEFDKERHDKYGRLLAYVYVDEVFVNAVLVRRGLAKVMTIGPNVRYKKYFQQLQKEAKEEGLGIWEK